VPTCELLATRSDRRNQNTAITGLTERCTAHVNSSFSGAPVAATLHQIRAILSNSLPVCNRQVPSSSLGANPENPELFVVFPSPPRKCRYSTIHGCGKVDSDTLWNALSIAAVLCPTLNRPRPLPWKFFPIHDSQSLTPSRTLEHEK
jgi:hypothetical protein